MINYVLMHKDTTCGTIAIDETNGNILSYKDNRSGASPFLGNCDLIKMKKWWEMRAVPASRNMIQDIMKQSGCVNPEVYLAKNLALSVTDTYWICPMDIELHYNDVKFSNLQKYNEGKIPYHNVSSYDPNASLGGQMEKYWEFTPNGPVLVKESSKYFGQQSINEVFATYIHNLQSTTVPFVKYTAVMTETNSVLCKCNAFTSDTLEFISAYEVLESVKNPNSISLYNQYIGLCIKNGIEREIIQNFMDYQTLTDFIISNTDEHLMNFGVLRNPDTLKFIGPAPIFDSGNSMFYRENRTKPYTRAGILERKITSFYETEEKMLAQVKNKNIVKSDLLPSPYDVKKMYQDAGIPSEKSEFIIANYEIKLKLLQEFQQGKKISLYQEKEREKKLSRSKKDGQKFIMVCGIPGSGKIQQAEKIVHAMENTSKKRICSEQIYPIEKIMENVSLVINRNAIMNNIDYFPQLAGQVTMISVDEIRKELSSNHINTENDLIVTIAEARVKAALSNHINVVYVGENLDKSIRQRFLDLADNTQTYTKQLYVMKVKPENAVTDVPIEELINMYDLLDRNMPSNEEGWSRVEYCGNYE